MKIRTKGAGRRAGYDPETPPEGESWLAMDVSQRRSAIERYHRDAGIVIPNLPAHALIHMVLENQIAEGLEPVRRVLARLMAEGLERHEALHAIGSVLARRLHAAVKEQKADEGEYLREIESLTAEKWQAGGE